MPPRATTTETPAAAIRTPDNFQLARQLYGARRRLLEKADRLYEDAPEDVRRICAAQEEADASKVIEALPTSPEPAT